MYRVILKLTLKQRRKILKLTGQNLQFLEVEVCPECRDKLAYYNQVPMYAYGFNQDNPPMNPRPRPRQIPPRPRPDQQMSDWNDPDSDYIDVPDQNLNEPRSPYNPNINVPDQHRRHRFHNPNPKFRKNPASNQMRDRQNPDSPENPYNSEDMIDQDQDQEE